jgi:FdhD protein
MHDTNRLRVFRLEERTAKQIEDDVVVEEPLEIRVNGDSIGVTMRTPGDDFDLVVGLMWTESFIRSASEIRRIEPELKNTVNVTLADATRRFESARKTWAKRAHLAPIRHSLLVERGTLLELPKRMREAQTNFERTDGIHAASLFDAAGKLILIREDLDRHNAVDKVLGAALRGEVPVSDKVLVVSGRLGFEIAQKAAVAGVPIVASVTAPSSLAVELAIECGMTAIGFVRGRTMNIYSQPQRVMNAISEYLA